MHISNVYANIEKKHFQMTNSCLYSLKYKTQYNMDILIVYDE